MSAETLAAGTVLRPGYEVLEHIARSSAYDVYDVWSELRDCRCVAKVVRPDRVDDPRPAEHLLREGALLLQFSHPHLVRAYEVHDDPWPLVILETITGVTLGRALEEAGGPIPLQLWVPLGIHLCSALHYLHGNGLLHLDLKPANVISERGFAKLVDLSTARSPGTYGPGLGTTSYRPPEQIRGGELREGSDVWGLCALLWTAATGDPPPGADPPTPVSTAGVPDQAWTLLRRGLAADPSCRPGVSRVADELAELQPDPTAGASPG